MNFRCKFKKIKSLIYFILDVKNDVFLKKSNYSNEYLFKRLQAHIRFFINQ